MGGQQSRIEEYENSLVLFSKPELENIKKLFLDIGGQRIDGFSELDLEVIAFNSIIARFVYIRITTDHLQSLPGLSDVNWLSQRPLTSDRPGRDCSDMA